MPVVEYDGMAARYAEKHAASEGFRFKPGKLEPYHGRIARSNIEVVFDTYRVIDIGVRLMDRAGALASCGSGHLSQTKRFTAASWS
jgi:hypothetical protein